MKFAALALLNVAIAAAQSGQGTGVIEGSVVDSTSQSPVRKAQVRLIPRMMTAPPPQHAGPPAPPRTPIAMTDAGGSFRFTDLPAGRYAVAAHHLRYPFRPGMEEKEVEVKDGQTTKIALPLDPGATITGRILDEEGDPIQGCMVRLQPAGTEMFGMPGVGMEQSNEQGEYRLWGIGAGKYVLSAQCGRPVFQPRPFSAGPPAPPTLAYPARFYPDADEQATAQPIELQPGMDRTGVDFRMKAARVYTVSGVVAAPEGRSLQHAMVELIRKGDVNPFERRNGRVNPRTGEFQVFNVFPGTYELIAGLRSPNLLEPALGGRQTVEVTDGTQKVRVVMHNAVDLAGSIAVDSDTPYAVNQTNIQLLPADAVGMQGAPPPAQVGTDGAFVLKGVLPGRWRITLHGPGAYLKSMELGGQPVEGKTIDLPPGSSGPLRLLVSTRTATLDARGTPGRHYLLVEDAGEAPRFATRHGAMADPQGRIRLPGLAPGKYRMYEGAPPAADAAAQEFTATEGSTVTLEFKPRE